MAAAGNGSQLAGGRTDGSVWIADVAGQGVRDLVTPGAAAISALAMSADGRRLAYGDEAGRAGLLDL